jgi:hypothetical protein
MLTINRMKETTNIRFLSEKAQNKNIKMFKNCGSLIWVVIFASCD